MIQLRVNGIILKYFAETNVTLSLDTVASTFSFKGFLDFDKEKIKEIFRPLTFPKCDVYFVDDENNINEKIITGIIINHALSTEKNESLKSLSGYSITGIFEDVSVPTELHPLETEGLGLDKIAEKFTNFFGLKLKIFDNAKVDSAKKIGKTQPQLEQTIKNYLSAIAVNRNITVAHDNFGRLLLYKVEAKIPPKVKIDESDQTIRITAKTNGQGLHSHVTVIRQAAKGNENVGETTIKSPFLPKNINRPIVKVLKVGDNVDTKKFAESILSREAKNFPIVIEKEGWTINNKLLRSGFYLELTAPSIFLKTTKLIIEEISFTEKKDSGKKMTIKCVLPCVYTGVLPSKSPFK